MSEIRKLPRDMNVLDFAFFLSGDQSLIGLVSNRVVRFDLNRDDARKVQSQIRWTAKLKYISNVVHAPEAGVVIATDTSGAHFGLSEKNGNQIWSTDPVGEGDPGIILPDGRFAFASWRGLMQFLNPATGRREGEHIQFLTQLRGIQKVGPNGRIIVRQSRLSEPDGRVWQAVAELDVASGKLRQITGELSDRQIWVDPTALFILSREALGRYDKVAKKGPPVRLELTSLSSGRLISSQNYRSDDTGTLGPAWSPDGEYIALMPSRPGYRGTLFLNAKSLEKQYFIPSKDLRSLTFGNVNSEVVFCQSPKSTIIQMDALPNWPAEPSITP